MTPRTFPILLAEDSKHDILAVQRAWKLHRILNPLHIVRDGEECLDFLLHRNQYASPADAPRPGLLLLDLNMPKMDGLMVLKEIRGNEAISRLPVIVLTTSKAEEDKVRSYELGVNAYIMKPVEFDGFASAIRAINVFWLLVELPYA
jgi:CheY-like chemotaxis protein